MYMTSFNWKNKWKKIYDLNMNILQTVNKFNGFIIAKTKEVTFYVLMVIIILT